MPGNNPVIDLTESPESNQHAVAGGASSSSSSSRRIAARGRVANSSLDSIINFDPETSSGSAAAIASASPISIPGSSDHSSPEPDAGIRQHLGLGTAGNGGNRVLPQPPAAGPFSNNPRNYHSDQNERQENGGNVAVAVVSDSENEDDDDDDAIQIVGVRRNPGRRARSNPPQIPRPEVVPVGDAHGNLRINEGIPPGPHPRIRNPREVPRPGRFIGGFGAFAGLGEMGVAPPGEAPARARGGRPANGNGNGNGDGREVPNNNNPAGFWPGPANPDNAYDQVPFLVRHEVIRVPRNDGPWVRNGPQQRQVNQPPKMPENYSTGLSHRSQSRSALYIQSQKGLRFSNEILEPPLNVETYGTDKTKVVGPLDANTVICSMCDDALIMGAEGDRKLFALPCGHVIDGKCYWKISLIKEKELEWEEMERRMDRQERMMEQDLDHDRGHGHGHGHGEGEGEEFKEIENELAMGTGMGMGMGMGMGAVTVTDKGKGKRKEIQIIDLDDDDEDQDVESRPRKSARLSSSSSQLTPASASASSSRPLRNGKASSLESNLASSKSRRRSKPLSAKEAEERKLERKRNHVYLKMGVGETNSEKAKQLRCFKCPVVGCGMKCAAEAGHRTSAFELFC